MEFVKFPKIPRYSRECVITEKIDGTNGQIIWEPIASALEYYKWAKNEAICYVESDSQVLVMYVGSRSRFLSLGHDNFGFAKWAMENAIELSRLGPGRHFGEWWGQGIQRGYGLQEKRFSLFNVKKWADPAVRPACCHVVPELARGLISDELIRDALYDLAAEGSAAAPGFMDPEGIVIFHTAGSVLFKKTLKGDEKGKWEE